MSMKTKLVSTGLALALTGWLGACGGSSGSVGGVGSSALVATATTTPVSGPVSFGGYTKSDGSAMTAAELAAAIALFPSLGVNYDQIRMAARADVAADGTVKLWNAAGGEIITIPAGSYQTIRSVQVTAGSSSEQGQCAGTNLLFDLSDSRTEQGQGQEQGEKEDKEEVVSAGFKVLLIMACEEPKQEEPKQEEPKQEEPKQEEPKQEEPKQVPSPTPSQTAF